MKRFTLFAAAAVIGLAMMSGGSARASWAAICYSGYQPWWNIFACRNKCMSCEEERLQKFWHDYYSALKSYYCDLDHIDWVAYYKNHGYQINANCGSGPGCCQRINYAPVFVSPTMQWAVPNSCLGGPPCAPQGPGCYGPGGYGGGPGGY